MTPVLSSAPFIHRRKCDSWASSAHPFVTVFYLFNGEADPVEVTDIRIAGSLLEPTTRKFFQRFGIDSSNTDLDWLAELEQHLHSVHPRGIDPDARRD